MPVSASAVPSPRVKPPRDTSLPESSPRRDRALGFVARIHRLRTLGLGLGFLCVASVFRLHGAPWYIWTLLVAHALAWPHVARAVATRSAHPVRAEMRHLTLDSTMGGVWVALMHFNLLPSVLFVTMLTVDKIAVAGPRLLLRTTACLAAACAATSAILGFPVDVATPMSVVIACTPFLVAYPVAISIVMHRLAHRVSEQNRWLAKVSTTDELTGLANRRQGLAAATQALAQFRRRGGDAVLMIVDIDRFKDINDRHGHPAGDGVLRDLAKVLVDNIRATDTAARYAGDEFLLVLPDTDIDGAAEMAKRIRTCFAAALAKIPGGANCSASLGAAAVYEDMADVEDWIQQADTALYRAKDAGRDRFVAAPRVEVPPRREAEAPRAMRA
ncbi:MAG TPA: diguanylate cyclase [Casimicrobiaceae bacterium]|jgi:diguanylate cyclase|nr:diguanylate cyclase [Casimicrobiaceae bacterium]